MCIRDRDSGLVHTVEATAANVHDATETSKLLTGDEDEVYGDSGYLGAEKHGDAKMCIRDRSVAMLYIGFGVLCGLSSGLCYNAVMSTMVRWFPDRPGLISGVLLMGFGGGSFIIGKLYQAWTPDWIGGWRVSFVVLGIICLLYTSQGQRRHVRYMGEGCAGGGVHDRGR